MFNVHAEQNDKKQRFFSPKVVSANGNFFYTIVRQPKDFIQSLR